ncbi:hypothetical protein D8Y22_19655 [Salinadaptatus halalkaliphilus]|uniref:DUF7511 domain-containing protein n=1 Tax=Salinadaptatus halalkaliphilus TaxID=2419781 RepID=A0A4S3TJ11_9EURY|nr:hypothetical protein [Salinadaptatus halalkaliphilus]THE63203.1 hypothetical protein D8Y22_19655 [Salinadaptatus halalkaliphilus]
MTDSSSRYDATDHTQRLADANPETPRTADLDSIVVRYDDGPDRCTITPRECPERLQLTAWLSADIDAFVDLQECR